MSIQSIKRAQVHSKNSVQIKVFIIDKDFDLWGVRKWQYNEYQRYIFDNAITIMGEKKLINVQFTHQRIQSFSYRIRCFIEKLILKIWSSIEKPSIMAFQSLLINHDPENWWFEIVWTANSGNPTSQKENIKTKFSHFLRPALKAFR